MPELPIILAVDDEPPVLAAVARDLQPRYGDRYRVLRAGSGAVALDTLKTLKLRGSPVALLIVDQRMPSMTGVEFLEQAIELFPDVKRVLLTAYADTEAAIKAINDVDLDLYLMKPWDPPEERLYPELDDLLEDWQASYFPPFKGLRLIGHRWSAESYDFRDFLSRNLIPYQWLDVEEDSEAQDLLAQVDGWKDELPVVIMPDGRPLLAPSRNEIVTELGLETGELLDYYDLVIIGAGPAGLAAGVYGASEGLRTLLVEREAPGGQAGTSSRIENYLGFPSGLSGADLARRGVSQARRLGAEILIDEAVGISVDENYRIVEMASGRRVGCQALLLTSGVSYRRLEVPGVSDLQGAGVYYGGSVAEAGEMTGENVFIVGGANSAGQAGVHFSKTAKCVTMVVRGHDLDSSGMSQYLVDRIESTPNIQVLYQSNVVEATGDGRLQSLRIQSKSGDEVIMPADRLYIFIGAKPYTEWISDLVALDGAGFIVTGPDLDVARNAFPRWPVKRDPFLLESNVPGIFAAGDIRHRSMKRIASATGEGAMAIHFVHQYLRSIPVGA